MNNTIISNYMSKDHKTRKNKQINNMKNKILVLITCLLDGNFVIVWQSYLEDGISYGIYGQIFYSNGATKGNEFHISNYNALNQTNPSVAASSNSKFMVVWQIGLKVFCQIFMNDGTKLNVPFQLNTITNPILEYPSISALKNTILLNIPQYLQKNLLYLLIA